MKVKKGFLSRFIGGPGRRNGEALAAKPAPESQLSIDYPQPGEKVCCGHYSIRISGAEAEANVAIDGHTWQSCRCDAGHWWYDWDAPAGTHVIAVRGRINGKWTRIERTCEVG